MFMANSEPTMDILDGSDVDEDNVGDVDVDQENVLLESDEEESHPHHLSKSMGGRSIEDRGRNLEEEDDVLNIALQDDEEILDYGGDDNDEDGEGQRLPPVKIRSSFVSNVGGREPSHLAESVNDPSASSSNNYNDNAGGGALVDENFGERQYAAEDDEYEDGDEETETRTRSRFTTERNVESRTSSGGGHSSSTSTIQTIQTLGEHKMKPNIPDGRPRHWNHNNGPRQGGPLRPNGPRHPGGRNHRFPPPRHGPPGENPHMRPMLNPPVVQFSEGLFTDFNQPMRHSHQGPRPRQPLPGAPQHPPRNPDQNVHRHPIPPPNSMNNNMRPNFSPQQPRPFFPSPQENQMRHPPRMQPPGPPGHIAHQHPQQHPPLRPPPPDFNMHGQRPQRFPPNNMHPNQRHVRPNNNNMNNQPHMQRPERPPFPPRHQRPPFRPDMQPQDPMGMHPQRYPHQQQGFPPQPPPHSGPHGFMPPHQQQPPRFMGPHGGGPPPENPHNSYYMQQHGGPGNYNHPPVPGEQAPYQPEAPWQGQPDQQQQQHMQPPGPGAPPNPNHPSHWPHQQPQHQHPPHHQQQQPIPHQQPSYSGIGGPYGNPNTMYEQAPPRPPLSHHNPILGQQAALTLASLQSAHSLDLPPITNKSIYINPNSEIHEALSKGGHFRHLKEEERRHETSTSRPTHGTSGASSSSATPSSSKHYDDYDHDHHHYHDRDRDRERSSSSRRPSSPDRRRDRDRDEDDYYDDRRKSSYHHYDERDRDRRPRRKYEEDSRDRRHRSDSPDKKMSRSDNYDRDRDRDRRDRDPVQNKEADKLLEEAKQLGLDEDYVKRLEEQRKLRERILKTKEQRRKQVKVPGAPDEKSSKSLSSLQKCVENEADSTVATARSSGSNSGGSGAPTITGKTKKVLRIVKDKSGKVISKKVHVVVVGKHQDGPQSTATS